MDQRQTRRAVFLDKDGTLIDDIPYNCDPALITLMNGATEGLQRLHIAGYLLVVVSNQSGVALGRFTEEALGAVEDRLKGLLEDAGVRLGGFYYCPHYPAGSVHRYAIRCDCRKPKPGLLFRAARDLALDLSSCWTVGDILDDVEAGRRAGCRTILIDNGHETEWQLAPERIPGSYAVDLRDAAEIITTADLAPADRERRPVMSIIPTDTGSMTDGGQSRWR